MLCFNMLQYLSPNCVRFYSINGVCDRLSRAGVIYVVYCGTQVLPMVD